MHDRTLTDGLLSLSTVLRSPFDMSSIIIRNGVSLVHTPSRRTTCSGLPADSDLESVEDRVRDTETETKRKEERERER